jgi:hypothetical protein
VSELTDKLRSKGYWDVTIRPETFSDQRVAYENLDELLESVVVRFRGWPVPFIDRRHETLHGDDWIGQDVDAVGHIEAWRFFTSCQFNHLRAVSADWRYVSLQATEATDVFPARFEFLPEGFDYVIEIWEILFYLTEVFELAARLALSPAGDDTMSISVQLNARERRGLIVGQANRVPFDRPFGPPPESITREVTVPREELVAEPRALAVDMAREFLLRFGWKPSREQLAEHQRELVG